LLKEEGAYDNNNKRKNSTGILRIAAQILTEKSIGNSLRRIMKICRERILTTKK